MKVASTVRRGANGTYGYAWPTLPGYRYTTPRGVGCLSSALFTGAMLGILKVVGLFIFNTYGLYRLIV